MGFTIDAELEDLRASVRAVLEREPVGATGSDESWRAIWSTAVELGWPTVGLPPEHDGLGLGQVGLALLLEAAGRFLCPAILSTAGLAGAALAQAARGPSASAGTPTGLADALASIAAGAVATLATDGPAEVERATGLLRGTFATVTDATRAELFVVAATRAGGAVLAVVVAGDPDVRVTPLPGPDLSVPIAGVSFDSADPLVTVAVDERAVLAAARTSVAADLLGGAQRSLELAVAYACERRQFDRVIGGFQAVKHPLADVFVQIERARSLTYGAAVMIDDPAADPLVVARTAAMAKAAASEAALGAAKVGIQTFGAMGTTWENDLHRFLGRARQELALFGTPRDLYLELTTAVAR